MKTRVLKVILLSVVAFCLVCLPMLTVSAAPAMSGDASITNLTSTGFSLTLQSNDADRVYYNVYPHDVNFEPNSLTFIPGASTMTKNEGTFSCNITGRSANSVYDVWIILQGWKTKWGIPYPDYSATKKIAQVKTLNNDANLSGLAVSSGTINPLFDTNAMSYSASVENSVDSIVVTPTLRDANARVTVNGSAPSTPVALNAGANTIQVVVSAQDPFVKKTYTIIVTRAPSTECKLLSVTTAIGSAVVNEGSQTVTADVPYGTTSTSIAATVSAGATWKLYSDSSCTTEINSMGLNLGANTAYIKVTAQDGTTNTVYTLTVTRQQSSDASLSGLSISHGTLTPVFNSAAQSYTATVDSSIESISVTPTATDPGAAITVNDVAVNSGSASGDINLNTGSNTIRIKVVAQDSTEHAYTVAVRRQSNACLIESVVKPSGGSISGTTVTASVPNNADSAEIAVSVSLGASWKLFDLANAEIADKTLRGLHVGDNLASIVVTAEDPAFTKTYTLVIKRTLSSDASLKALSLSSGALSPVFAPGTKSYRATVANNVSMITVTPTVNDPKATIKIRNVPVSSGTPSQPLFLSMGDNTIDVKVTAEDGSLQTYSITVRRSSNACEILSISYPGSAYKSGSDWQVGVGNDTTAVRFEVLVSPLATWKLYRDPFCISEIAYATMQNLVEGDNIAYIKVVAEDGTAKVFRVIVTRGGPSRSSNNRIQYLVLNGGTLNPYFSPYITSYTAHVPYETSSVTVRVTTEFARADIRVNGKWIVSGGTSAAISLFEGDNTISIAIMAETGALNTYTISIYRDFAVDQVVEVPQTSDPSAEIPLTALVPIILLCGLWIARKHQNHN